MKKLLFVLMGILFLVGYSGKLVALDISKFQGQSSSMEFFSEVRFGNDGKLYLYVNIGKYACTTSEIKTGALTKYVHVTGLDRFAVSNSGSPGELRIVGDFAPYTQYELYVDGMICGQSGHYYTTIKTKGYSAEVAFISKGLYFSEKNPVLRYRHREVDSITWRIYRIENKYRHLFSRTEDILFNDMYNADAKDVTKRDFRAFRLLKDYPGTPITIQHKLNRAADWAVGEINLGHYAKGGDWLVIVSDWFGINKLVQFTNVGVQYRTTPNGDFIFQSVRLDTGVGIPTDIRFKDRHGKWKMGMKTNANGFLHGDVGNLSSLYDHFDVIHNGDRITIPLGQEGIPLGSFPIEGEKKGETRKAFVYSDRGLYRLGETVHLTAIIKDLANKRQEARAVEFMLYGPTGKLKNVDFPSYRAEDGAYTWSWPVPDNGKTGEYQLKVREHGEVIGTETFSVEQIIPPTLEGDIKMTHPAGEYDHENETLINSEAELTSKFLFGAPASEKRWEYSCNLRRGFFQSREFPKYHFHDSFKKFPEFTFYQEKDLYLDYEGKGNVNCNQSGVIGEERLATLPGIGNLRVVANIYEEGGRYIEVTQNSPVWFHEAYPGIRPMFIGNLEKGQDAVFKLIAVDPKTGKAKPDVKLKVEILEKDYWGWFYFHKPTEPIIDSEITRIKRDETLILTKEEATEYRFSPQGEGEWEILVTLEGSEVSSRFTFRNKRWEEDAGMGNAVSQQITFTPDKKKYREGDKANILVTAPFDGTLYITEEVAGKELNRNVIQVKNRQAKYEFTITAEHAPWMFLTGTLLRTAPTVAKELPTNREESLKEIVESESSDDEGLSALKKKFLKIIGNEEKKPKAKVKEEKRESAKVDQPKEEPKKTGTEVEMPYRALGLLPIEVLNNKEILKFSVDAPKSGKPESEMELEIQATDGSGNPVLERVYMTVAVVDEGILQLGKYKTPNPYPMFHKQPAYQVAWYDSFGKVVPYSLHKGRSIYGSDQTVEAVVPKKVDRVVPMAYWSGIVKTGEDGKLKLPVPINDYSGKVRVMIVGWKDRMLGNFDRKIPVFSPIDIYTSLPRVFGVFDQSRAVVEAFNNTKQEQSVTLSIKIDGMIEVLNERKTTLTIPPNRSKTHFWDLSGEGAPGSAFFTFKAKSEAGSRTRTTELLLRPVSPNLSLSVPFSIAGNESKTLKMPNSLEVIPGSGTWQVNLSGSPVVKISKHLRNLISYPHGCAEQTTSRLFAMTLMKPTLGEEIVTEYLGDKAEKSDEFIKAGIKKLSRMQMSDGGFAYWLGGRYQYDWLNPYVTHFLWKAKQQNYEVPDAMINRALSKLRWQYNYNSSIDVVAYSAFVLALHNQLSSTDLTKLVRQYVPKEFKQKNRNRRSKSLKGFMNDFLKAVNKKANDEGNQPQKAVQKELTQKEKIALPFVKATLRLLGEQEKVKTLFDGFNEPSWNDKPNQYWRNHHFLYRDAAAAATLYTTAVKQPDQFEGIIEFLDYLSKKNYLSTHTAAWTLLAVDEAFRAADHSAGFTIQGPNSNPEEITPEPGKNRITGSFLGDVQTLQVQGSSQEQQGRVFGVATFSGVPKKAPETGYSKKLSVNRVYFTEFGEILTPPFKANQGERIYVGVSAGLETNDFESLKNVVIEDWLPAGFELENPRLLTNVRTSFYPESWAYGSDLKPDHVDYLDDRIAIFGTMERSDKTFFYSMRAITQGDYQVLPIRAESMYIPEVKAMAVQNGRAQIVPAGTITRNTEVPNTVARLPGSGGEVSGYLRGIGYDPLGKSFCKYIQNSNETIIAGIRTSVSEKIGWWRDFQPFKDAMLKLGGNGAVMRLFYQFHKKKLIGNIKLNCSMPKVLEMLDEALTVLEPRNLSTEKQDALKRFCTHRDYYYGEEANNVYSKVSRNECDYYHWFQKYARQGVNLGVLAELVRDFRDSLEPLQQPQASATKQFLLDFVLNETFGGANSVAKSICVELKKYSHETLSYALLSEMFMDEYSFSDTGIFKDLLSSQEIRSLYENKKDKIFQAITRQCSMAGISSQFLVNKLDEMIPLINAREIDEKKELLFKKHCQKRFYRYDVDPWTVEGITYSECHYYQWFRSYRNKGFNLKIIYDIATDLRDRLLREAFNAEEIPEPEE